MSNKDKSVRRVSTANPVTQKIGDETWVTDASKMENSI